jgi:hypothetical protein
MSQNRPNNLETDTIIPAMALDAGGVLDPHRRCPQCGQRLPLSTFRICEGNGKPVWCCRECESAYVNRTNRRRAAELRARHEAGSPELSETERKRQQGEQLDALAAVMRLPLPSYTG